MRESGFSRLWNAVKPRPLAKREGPPPSKHKLKQIKILRATFVAVLVLASASIVYIYIADAPERADAQFQAGMRLMGPGDYRQAIEKFTRAVSIYETGEAYLERGSAHQYLNEIDLALADFDKATTVDPNLARGYSAKGAIYRDRKDFRRAIEELTKAVELDPTLDAYYQRAQTYEALGEFRKAIEDYDAAIVIARDAPQVYRARSLAKRNLGDMEGSEADRDKAKSMERR
jgi:tetratricopeptide (TPR) repeat protein